MLPVTLDVSGRLVVVVGGGAVGARKATAAAAAGAVVRVVDPALAGGPREPAVGTSPESEVISEAYRPDHLDGGFLAFACATPEVNARVVADARLRRILVNSSTDPRDGDFALPSVVRSGDLTIAVSTGGAAPALARRVREKLAADFGGEFADWVRVLADVRAAVLAEVPDPPRRRELLDGFAGWPWLERLRADGAAATPANTRPQPRRSMPACTTLRN